MVIRTQAAEQLRRGPKGRNSPIESRHQSSGEDLGLSPVGGKRMSRVALNVRSTVRTAKDTYYSLATTAGTGVSVGELVVNPSPEPPANEVVHQ